MSGGPRSVPMPERVGRYEVLLPLASGGMATVYLARSSGAGGFEREVALKLTHPHLQETEGFAADLLEEAKLAARIRHPNVVPVLDCGEDPHGVFLVMDLVDGDSLSGLLRAARKQQLTLTKGVLFRILCDALDGLHAAHELRDDDGNPVNLVHRDFSPHNVLVGRDGVSRLTDFGVAKAATRVGHTATGLVKGKIRYMAPEQAKSEGLDRRCDVWAAGVIAWELATGRRLYGDQTNETAILLDLITKAPPLVTAVSPDAGDALAQAVAGALTIDPAARCATARELSRALATALPGGLAEQAEVGEVVRRLTDRAFHERRAKIAEIRSLRSTMGQIARSASKEDSSSSHVGLLPATTPTEPPKESTGSGLREATLGAAVATDAPVEPPRPAGARGRAPMLLAAGALLGVVGGLGFWASRGPSAPAAAPTSSANAAPTATAAPTLASAAVAAPTQAPSAAAKRVVALTANAAIAAARVGARVIKLPRPVAAVSVELDPGEREVELTASDGRKQTVTVEPDRAAIDVKFPAPKAASPGGPNPLAKSPYEQ